MKQFIYLLFAIIFMLPAQDVLAQIQPEIGIRAGGALAQIRGDEQVFGENEKATDRQPALMGGIYAEVPVSRHLSVQPEILYVQKGGRMTDDFSEGGLSMKSTSDFNLDYVGVPVLVKYNIPVAGRISPSVYAGPYAAYAVNRKFDFKVSGDDGNFDFSVDADDVFRRWDYGATAGVDLGYMISGRKATLGLRYDLGLANIFQDEISGDFMNTNAKARNHEVGVVLGIRLF